MAEQAQPPNIVLVVVDDLGWADLGSFGSEIRTPHIDALARNGLTMTHLRAAPTCSPTRAMLLTGVDHHLVGLGTMEGLQAPNQRDSVYYEGELHEGVVTLAEALSSNGYATAMAGKWHLAKSEENYPHNRGFDRSFTLLQGGASHFGDALPLHQNYVAQYLEDGHPVELPTDFYSSISYTDKIINYIGDIEENTPFFAYLAFTAPHDPLQVPKDWLHRYSGEYDQGPEVTREKRIANQKALRLIPQSAEPSTPKKFPKWSPMGKSDWEDRTKEQRLHDARPMEIYAAMVELLDQQVGRLVDALDSKGILDNTYIVFMSDNGASAMTPLVYPDTTREWLLNERKQGVETMGTPGSHTYLGMEWASVSNAPFRLFKTTVAEGGVRVPFIVTGPGVSSGRIVKHQGHVTDVTPTILELAGIVVNESKTYQDKVLPQGESMVGLWEGGVSSGAEDRIFGFELFGNSAVVVGRWKASKILSPLGSGDWELFDLLNDPGETVDLSEDKHAKLTELVDQYHHYEISSEVIAPIPPLKKSASVLYAGECNWWCEFRFSVIEIAL